MTAGDRGGSASQAWSADAGMVSLSRRDNRAGTGSASVTVHGASLGLVAYTGMAREGHTGCEGTEWESETSVRCMVAGFSAAVGSVRVVISAPSLAGDSVSMARCAVS